MTLYATVDNAIDIYGLAQQTATPRNINPRAVFRNLQVASRRVDQLFQSNRPLFAPYIETRKFALDGTRINSRLGTFQVDGWLLAVTSVSINGTAVTVEAYPDSSTPPFRTVRLTADCQSWYSQVCSCCTPLQVEVAGVWGFHPDYAHAWMRVDALAAAITLTDATTLTVADADGADEYGMTPRFSPGALIKIDSEYMEVVSVDTNLNVLTVRRGENGSTATTHLITAPIYTWQVDYPVQRAVARQSGLMLSRNGAYVTTEVRDMSAVHYPQDWLQEVFGVMQAYAYS